MKKIVSIILTFVMMLSMITVAHAATSPVKDVIFVDGNNCFLVLMENGTLYMGDSLDTQTPIKVNTDVKDVVLMRDILNSAKRIQVLHNNGNVDIVKINIDLYLSDGMENTYEHEKTLKVNASQIFETDESYKCLYITNEGILKKHDTYRDETISIMNNVKHCPVTSKYSLMAISNDNILFSLEYNSSDKEYITNKIMTNVVFANDRYILRNNGDLYLYKNTSNYILDVPERVETGIQLPNQVEYFDVKKSGYSDKFEIDYNAKRFEGDAKNLSMSAFGDLYCNNKFFLSNVKKVIITDNPYRKGAFFITNNGELYASNTSTLSNSQWEYGYYSNPFLTIFGQKTTKIYLNNKEVQLSAKIQERDNRTFYPFRECLEQLGATVLWDNTNKIAIGEYNGITIEFPIGSNKYYINGTERRMDTFSYIDDSIGRTYIPIRFAAEGLGFIVDWIEGDTENTISIHR